MSSSIFFSLLKRYVFTVGIFHLFYRHTATRQNRLEVLRKGKKSSSEGRDSKKDLSLTPNSKQLRDKTVYNKTGRRGVSRKRRVYNEDDSEGGTVDTTIAFVCINRLAEEFNTEDSIKRFYRLDSQNRLPAQVVTIDDDDDDEEDDDNGESDKDGSTRFETRGKHRYSEYDLDYLSFLRVKPNKLSKTETELFEKKMEKNTNSARNVFEADDDINNALVSVAGGRNKGRSSLNSVISRLTANRSTPAASAHSTRSALLEQYKQNKKKNKTISESSTEQQNNNISSDPVPIIDLSNDDPPQVANAVNAGPDGSINIPGKGQYKIMEQIVTKQGDKNKIILRLGKPPKQQEYRPHQPQQADVTPPTRNSPSSIVVPDNTHGGGGQVYTNINEMYTLEHMARSHNGLDEMLKNRFDKVHSYCKDLPRNPLQWDKQHVTMFIINADFEKYISNFYEQVSWDL